MKRLLIYLKYLWMITEGFHRIAIWRTLLGVVRVALVLVFIWLSKTAIDCAIGKEVVAPDSLLFWFSLMVADLLLDVVVSRGIQYIETRSVMQMNIVVNRHLFNVLMLMPFVNGQQGFHSGDMLERLTTDVRTICNFSLYQLPSMIVMGVQLVGAFWFLASMSPYLALAPIIIMPVCILASKLYFKKQRWLTAKVREAQSEATVSIQEGLKHRMILRSLDCVGEMDRRLGRVQDELDDANRRQTKLSVASGAMVRLGFLTGYLIAFGWSIFSLQAGVITYGTMTAFIQLVARIQNPIAGISGYIPAFIATSVAVDRLRDIDAYACTTGVPACGGQQGKRVGLPPRTGEDACATSPQAGTPVVHGIRISDLSFRYEPDSEQIYSDFSYDFRPGSRTLIVGTTGAGKTTLIKLLLGLLTPDSGSIELYDGRESRKVSAETISNFVYVPQGNTLLHGTIRDNLLLAAPDASEEQLREALHTAAADFVFDLPMGLETSCDETGAGISEGQAQRIAIARALLRPGSILLLDEFNSALDVETAETLMKRLVANRPDSTILIIAHHQTAVAPFCDHVLNIPCNTGVPACAG